MQLSKAMNEFYDEQGRVWLCTPKMAKRLGVSDGGLAAYKHNGTLKRGIHWVQQAEGQRRVFYNKDAIIKWWQGEVKEKLNLESKPKETLEDTSKETARNVSLYLSKDLYDSLRTIQENSKVTVERKIDGIILHTQEEKPKMGTIANMLIARAIKDYYAETAK
jgi:hypothetical protein